MTRPNNPMDGDNAADTRMTRARGCGARTRAGTPCRKAPMANGRCLNHGGASTGPPKGNTNALKHGERSAAMIEQRRNLSALLREMRADLAQERWAVS